MKLMHITAMILFALSLTNVQAGTGQVGGLIIGGGTGAIVGQAVGRNTESTIVGAAVGGVVGLIVGTELDRRHHGSVNQPSEVIVYASSNNHRRGPEVRHHFPRHPRYHYDRHRQFHQPRHYYKKTVVIEKGHHKTKRTVTTFRGGGYRDHYQKNKSDRRTVRFHH